MDISRVVHGVFASSARSRCTLTTSAQAYPLRVQEYHDARHEQGVDAIEHPAVAGDDVAGVLDARRPLEQRLRQVACLPEDARHDAPAGRRARAAANRAGTRSEPSSAQTTLPSRPPIAPSTRLLGRDRLVELVRPRKRPAKYAPVSANQARPRHSRTTPGPASPRVATHQRQQRERHGDEERPEPQRARAEGRRLDRAEADQREERTDHRHRHEHRDDRARVVAPQEHRDRRRRRRRPRPPPGRPRRRGASSRRARGCRRGPPPPRAGRRPTAARGTGARG